MASGDEANAEPEIKKCKYCKGNVDIKCVKCCDCGIYLHQSCALRITGLRVSSGSKNQVLCSVCEKNAREEAIRKLESDIAAKGKEIELLKLKISEILNENKTFETITNKIMEKLESVENNITNKIVSTQQEIQKKILKKKGSKSKPRYRIKKTTRIVNKQKSQGESAAINETTILRIENPQSKKINSQNTEDTNRKSYKDTLNSGNPSRKAQGQSNDTHAHNHKNVNNGKAKTENSSKEKHQNNVNDAETGGFQEVGNKRHNRRVKKLGTYQSSNSENNEFVGGDRRVWLYINRVKRSATEEIVGNYIKNKPGNANMKVIVKEIPAEHNQLKAFVVVAPMQKKDELYQTSFWPCNVGIQRFDFKKHKQFLQESNEFFQ